MSQPGIQPRYVVVVYNPAVLPDAPQLCQLFGFNFKPTKATQYHGEVKMLSELRVPDMDIVVCIELFSHRFLFAEITDDNQALIFSICQM